MHIFYRTAVIYRAQRRKMGISHSLFPECRALDADRAISAMPGVQTTGRIVRSDAAIFRSPSAVEAIQYRVDENKVQWLLLLYM